MNIAEYFIRHRVISWMFALILLLGGILSFFRLGQLEFPEFTIKMALVVTEYPGASAQQVEEEVTLPLEDAIQSLPYIYHLTSINSAGRSQIIIEVKDQYRSEQVPQIWDEVRRKVNDLQRRLPPGVMPPTVIDDFGDVFGMLYNITGDGFNNKELQDYADQLRRELVLVPGVKKISIDGIRRQQVVVEISRQRLQSLGINPKIIFGLLQQQNAIANAGKIFTGSESIQIHPNGEMHSVEELKNILIPSPVTGGLVKLGDLAEIKKVFEDTPSSIYHSNGKEALSFGISFAPNVNVVDVSKAVLKKLKQLDDIRPIGVHLTQVYNQGNVVEKAIDGFMVNLIEAVVIVIVVLLLFMGSRSGLLMGLILLLTILGTFIVMRLMNINMQLISLGALIIALGMLVDNAIVITEGMLIATHRGMSKLQAAKQVVTQNQWPLLGATVIAIVAFAPIGLSPDNVGEFAGSLFWVLLISLALSWITAISLTPFFFDCLFKETENSQEGEDIDPYQGGIFRVYRRILNWAIHHRMTTMVGIVLILVVALGSFGFVKNSFFPASTTPIFFVDYWMPEGTDIRATEKAVAQLEREVLELDEVKHVTTVIGHGAQRFILTYAPERSYSSYSQLIVEVDDLDARDKIIPKVLHLLQENHPQAEYRVKKLENGPAPAAKIEARFYGDDPQMLRQLAAKTIDIFKANPNLDNIRHDWRHPVKVVRPKINEAQSRLTGINKQDISDALLMNFNGKAIGVYREGSDLMPIVARSPEAEQLSISSLNELLIYSEPNKTYVPIGQVVSNMEVQWEDPIIMRRDRKRTLTVLANPHILSNETADSALKQVRADVEAIPLPDGYHLEWGGEMEKSRNAQKNLFASLPLGLLIMFLITVFLFNTVKQPLVIWAMVPLSIIGVVIGLLSFDAPFSFMALLGVLSLNGMVIKNGIVLVEQIKLELEQGKSPLDAVIHSAISRVRPVSMAALTTMLGMIPLIFDAFYFSMAVAIIFGLGFATLLTLIILPVLYTLAYKIPVPEKVTA
jgi:multidrug efflux pump subunit AcrB